MPMLRKLVPMRLWSLIPFALLKSGSAQSSNEQLPARPSDTNRCQCQDPVTGNGCYEPVCPPGYFRCCASCGTSTCFGTQPMQLSWRGIRECIPCEPGDFCSGCDTFRKCPPNTVPGRQGPRISRAKATRMVDCEGCPVGQEASLSRDICVDKYTHVCNEDVVQRCIRNCEAEDAERGKLLTRCELMKCTMYCAKSWSEECARTMGSHCRSLTGSPDAISILDGNVEPLVGCNVDCNGVIKYRGKSTSVLLMLLLSWALQ